MPKVSRHKDPTLQSEHEAAAAGFEYFIGCDEVGRGAIAGPVAVGAAMVRSAVQSFPSGLRDSKLLSEKRRELMFAEVSSWVVASAVGFASATEIDRFGITAMLGTAARRALLELHSQGQTVEKAYILLDGSHDWLSPALQSPLTVRTLVKADQHCATVAAASVLAKVHRDQLMRDLHESRPEFGWASNKGYGSAQHYDALREHGLSEWHRASWIRA